MPRCLYGVFNVGIPIRQNIGLSETHFGQLIGIINWADDPGLSAIRAIVSKALPERAP